MAAVKGILLQYFMPEKCFNEFFSSLNLLHGPCVRIVFRKSLGFWVILGTVFARLPQIVKLWRSGSAEGLSFLSILLEMFSIMAHLVGLAALGFPIGAWGDVLFTFAQLLLIGFLIQHCSGHTLRGLGLVLSQACLLSLLLSPVTPRHVISVMETTSAPTIILARLLQTLKIHCSGHTGQLSVISVFLLLVGSLAHLLTSVLDSLWSVTFLLHLVVFCADTLLMSQMLLCKKNNSDTKRKGE